EGARRRPCHLRRHRTAGRRRARRAHRRAPAGAPTVVADHGGRCRSRGRGRTVRRYRRHPPRLADALGRRARERAGDRRPHVAGAVGIAPADVWAALWGGADQTTGTIVRDLRLTRVFAAALVGGSLAVAGALLQGLLRNPLADPYVTGTSAGASLSAVAAIAL